MYKINLNHINTLICIVPQASIIIPLLQTIFVCFYKLMIESKSFSDAAVTVQLVLNSEDPFKSEVDVKKLKQSFEWQDGEDSSHQQQTQGCEADFNARATVELKSKEQYCVCRRLIDAGITHVISHQCRHTHTQTGTHTFMFKYSTCTHRLSL